MPSLRARRRTVLNFAFCTFVATMLGLESQGTLVPRYFAISYSIGFSVQVCTWLGRAYAPPTWPLLAMRVAMTGCGLIIGLALGGVLVAGHPAALLENNASLLLGVLISVLAVAAFEGAKQLWDTRERLARAERDALAHDKARAEAELRVLQAQVEPHFLFNTLANVIALVRSHPDRAARLLEQLTALLRTSLSRTRRADGTLGDELAVVRAYLDIQAQRMGARMTYDMEVEPGLETVRMPPLLVQPLVENAVLHGIEPSAAGGSVLVSVERSAGAVRIRVTDDGVGMNPDTAGHGLGIANVRERLQSSFGTSGTVALSETPGGGVSAVLRIPVTPGADAAGPR